MEKKKEICTVFYRIRYWVFCMMYHKLRLQCDGCITGTEFGILKKKKILTKVSIREREKSREKCIWKNLNGNFTIFWEKYTIKYIYNDIVVQVGIPVNKTSSVMF